MSQKRLVADLSKKKVKEKVIEYRIEDIRATGEKNVFKTYVYERIGTKSPGKKDFTAKEYYWVYTVAVKNNKFSLCAIERWLGQ
jgi:hypothetical protein